MRRVLVDDFGAPVYPIPGQTFPVLRMAYRVSDDNDPEGDILLVTVDPQRAMYTSMHSLPITSVR